MDLDLDLDLDVSLELGLDLGLEMDLPHTLVHVHFSNIVRTRKLARGTEIKQGCPTSPCSFMGARIEEWMPSREEVIPAM